MHSPKSKETLMHEYFNQIEYKTIDNAFRDLALKEFFMPNWDAYAPRFIYTHKFKQVL
jgi:hypothetical protein